jgi:hypothetical protein
MLSQPKENADVFGILNLLQSATATIETTHTHTRSVLQLIFGLYPHKSLNNKNEGKYQKHTATGIR